jgi:hypothetical protein
MTLMADHLSHSVASSICEEVLSTLLPCLRPEIPFLQIPSPST